MPLSESQAEARQEQCSSSSAGFRDQGLNGAVYSRALGL